MEKATSNALLLNINAEATPAYGRDWFCCSVIQVNITPTPCALSKAFLSSLLVLPSCRMLIVFGTNPKMLSQWELAQLCAAQPMSSQHTQEMLSPMLDFCTAQSTLMQSKPRKTEPCVSQERTQPHTNPQTQRKRKCSGKKMLSGTCWVLDNQPTYS